MNQPRKAMLTALLLALTAASRAAAAACIDSAGTWRSAPLTSQAGLFTVEFDAVPGLARMDGVSGLSNGAASGYASLAAAVRFNTAGKIDARNGAAYAASASVRYTAGTSYHFRLVVDLPAHAYTAYVKPPGGPEQRIANAFAFRVEQKSAAALDTLALLASSGSESVCGAAVTASPAPPAPAASFFDDFSSYATNACLADGAVFGPWTSLFNGYGCNSVKTDGAKFWLEERPFSSASPSETHAAMVLGPSFAAPLTLSVEARTVAQLRTGSPPNAWEVAWVVWNYADNSHFYYLAPKPNGWELGKADPAYPGAQRFLATGSSPLFPAGAAHAVKIVQSSNVLSIFVDGALLAAFTDTERPYLSGKIGLYNEDANVRFTNVAVNTSGPAALAASPAGSYSIAAAADAKAPQKFLSPALRDGINDEAVFGAAAAEVSIYDMKGRVVFRAERRGAAPIVWDGRDGSGRVRDSGAYIARIRQDGSETLYQTFVLVK